MLNHKNKNQSGFALLMTLVVVSVVISVALTLIDLTIKQLRLSTGSKDSENAFHAANAGVECIRYWRVAEGGEFEKGDGDTVDMSCFEAGSKRPTKTHINDTLGASVNNAVYKYEIDFTWGNRCSQATFITMTTLPSSAGVTLNTVINHIPNYPENSKTCEAGGLCTIILVQGYNQPCPSPGNEFPRGTIQREVLLEL